ncbi:MAG TPA: esterase [Casimicrobiaceae bacterium]|nr:esterase [Casimicrobiaceae bacterium]
MNLDTTLHLLPREGQASPLFIFLHGRAGTGLHMAQVADRFAQAYPHAAHLIPDGFDASDDDERGRQWFSARDIDEASRVERVAAAVPRLVAFVREAQVHFGVSPVATALVGFSQGGIMALELAQSHQGLVGRVIALAARYAKLPETAPPSVIHLVHGKEDAVVPARHSVEAATRLVSLGGDVTADIVPGIGHAPHAVLVDRALDHLKTFLPRRVWAEAMAEAPLVSTRADSRDLARPRAPPAANDPT